VLAEQIRSILQQPDLLEQMGQRGRALLEQRFSRKYCVDQYEAMLADICRPVEK
jgi:glycosyltransferase involved in cell wall biosynthesis